MGLGYIVFALGDASVRRGFAKVRIDNELRPLRVARTSSHKKKDWLALLEMYGVKRRRGIKGTRALRGVIIPERFAAIVRSTRNNHALMLVECLGNTCASRDSADPK